MGSMKKIERLRGGTFNLKFGRQKDMVKDEVERLLKKHDLDFLCVQEAKDYVRQLTHIDGYSYYVDRTGKRGATECGILVRKGLETSGFKVKFYGDGWFMPRGGTHAETVQPQVKIEWLLVRSLHLPTPSHWAGGVLASSTPAERKDDLIAAMQGLRRYFRWPCIKNARLAAGDWNEPPTTIGLFSPRWLMSETGAVGIAADSRVGHGRIDWPMVKGARIVKVFKDLEVREGSDHEPVIFVLEKLTRRK